MVLLGSAGLLIVHQFLDAPPAARAQPPGAGGGGGAPPGPAFPGAGGEARHAAEPGLYKDIVGPLLESLADPDGGVRQFAAATLVKIGPDAQTPLIEALKAKDRETRANAAYVLGHLSPSGREALPALAKALKDEDKEVRRRAAFALHNLVGRSEAGPLVAGGAAGVPDLGAEGGAGVAPPAPVAQGPRPGWGGGGAALTAGMIAPIDPGLLLPPVSPPAKPEK
jgi:hypothetical protein